jgi:hypothetical protein
MRMKHTRVTGAVLAMVATTFFAGARAARGQANTIQMTNVFANVEKTVDSKKAKAGDPFTAKTTSGTTLNDGTNVPIGSVLEGHVDAATPSDHKSDGSLVVTIDKVQIKDGKEIAVKAVILSVASFEAQMGADNGPAKDRAFDTSPRDSARVNGSDPQSSSSGPHPVKGLTVAGTVKDPNSGTFTQAKGNVHLSNENRLEVTMAVIPPGTNLQ